MDIKKVSFSEYVFLVSVNVQTNLNWEELRRFYESLIA